MFSQLWKQILPISLIDKRQIIWEVVGLAKILSNKCRRLTYFSNLGRILFYLWVVFRFALYLYGNIEGVLKLDWISYINWWIRRREFRHIWYAFDLYRWFLHHAKPFLFVAHIARTILLVIIRRFLFSWLFLCIQVKNSVLQIAYNWKSQSWKKLPYTKCYSLFRKLAHCSFLVILCSDNWLILLCFCDLNVLIFNSLISKILNKLSSQQCRCSLFLPL
jgi:hypothetical protein